MKLRQACQRNRWNGEKEKADALFEWGKLAKNSLFSEIKYVDIRDRYSFESLWYLVCLFHEKGCQCETERGKMKDKREDMLVFGEKNKNWSPVSVCFSPSFVFADGGIVFGDNIIVRECVYPEIRVRDFFYQKYVCDWKGEADHGIVGGLLLYDEMIQYVLEKEKRIFKKYSDLFSYLSCVLMVHNLFYTETSKKLRFTEDPMLYLLVLTHAIDPLQTFEGIVGEMVYESIDVMAEKSRILFTIPKSEISQQYVKNAESYLRVLEIGWKIEANENCISMQLYTG